MARLMKFKMERPGLVNVGEIVEIREASQEELDHGHVHGAGGHHH